MIVNDIFLKAVSWTLVHSIWQGFLLAMLSGVVIMATRKASAALRYNLIAGLFVGFLIGAAITFNSEFKAQEIAQAIEGKISAAQAINNASLIESTIVAPDFFQVAIGFLNKNTSLIAFCWFLIFCVRCVGIFTQLCFVYKIRNYKTFVPLPFWQTKINELSSRIKLRQAVVLLESTLVKAPSVTGFLKPILLVPVGLLANLPHDQIEAILLHELAHIRRKDYLMNIFQSLAELIFFFNPGLIWVSAILREERESCCDDIAISATENKPEFVRALLSFEEYKYSAGSLAMGFGGNKNHLLNRARRIFDNNNQSLNQMEKSLISISFVVILSITLACSNSKVANTKSSATTSSHTVSTNIDERSNENYEDAMAQAQYALQDAEAAKADQQAAIADQQAAIADAATAKEDAKAAIEDAKAALENAKIAKQDAKQAKANSEMAKADQQMEVAEKALRQAEKQIQESEEMIEKAKISSDVRTPVKASYVNTTSTTVTTMSSKSDKINQAKNSKSKSILTVNSEKNIEENEIANVIIADLIADKIISSNANLSYALSAKKFVVNGVQQPEAIRAKFNKIYVSGGNTTILYNSKSVSK